MRQFLEKISNFEYVPIYLRPELRDTISVLQYRIFLNQLNADPTKEEETKEYQRELTEILDKTKEIVSANRLVCLYLEGRIKYEDIWAFKEIRDAKHIHIDDINKMIAHHRKTKFIRIDLDTNEITSISEIEVMKVIDEGYAYDDPWEHPPECSILEGYRLNTWKYDYGLEGCQY